MPVLASANHRRVGEWIARYAPAEVVGITCALAAAYGVRLFSTNVVVMGYAGAWGESIGYGGVIIGRDFLKRGRRQRPSANAIASLRSLSVSDVVHVIRNLLTEFGPSTLLDTFVTRPLAMSVGMHALGPTRGLIAGKLAADVVFYIPVILLYERNKRRR